MFKYPIRGLCIYFSLISFKSAREFASSDSKMSSHDNKLSGILGVSSKVSDRGISSKEIKCLGISGVLSKECVAASD